MDFVEFIIQKNRKLLIKLVKNDKIYQKQIILKIQKLEKRVIFYLVEVLLISVILIIGVFF